MLWNILSLRVLARRLDRMGRDRSRASRKSGRTMPHFIIAETSVPGIGGLSTSADPNARPVRLPLCPKCTSPAKYICWAKGLPARAVHDLNCKKCGVQVLGQAEFDRLQWVERKEISWHPPSS